MSKITLHPVKAPAGELAYFGTEPKWAEGYEPKNYMKEMLDGLAWHGYCAGRDDWPLYLDTWIRTHRPTAQDALDALGTIKGKYLDPTFSGMARMHLRGFPFTEADIARIDAYIDRLPDIAVERAGDKKEQTVKVTVRDRVEASVAPLLGDIDTLMDRLTDGDKVDGNDVLGLILEKGLKGPHLKIITDHINRYLEEYEELHAGRLTPRKDLPDALAQLVEGHKHLKPATLTRLLAVLQGMRNTLTAQVSQAKITRVRKAKPADHRKMVSKLRFARSDEAIGLDGLDPIDIIGANLVWYYDKKKRLLGVLHAESPGSIMARGPKIVGVAETSSAKILRRPEEQLAEFLELRKNQTQKWYESIRAVPKAATGRTTADMVLIRVD